MKKVWKVLLGILGGLLAILGLGAKASGKKKEEIKKQRNEDVVNSLEEMKKSLKKRIDNDRERYLKYYNVDYSDEKHYDLVIDTSNINAEEVAKNIIAIIGKKKRIDL